MLLRHIHVSGRDILAVTTGHVESIVLLKLKSQTSDLLIITSLVACQGRPDKGSTYKWNVDNVRYENFTDLGNYAIDVDIHTNFNYERAFALNNSRDSLDDIY